MGEEDAWKRLDSTTFLYRALRAIALGMVDGLREACVELSRAAMQAQTDEKVILHSLSEDEDVESPPRLRRAHSDPQHRRTSSARIVTARDFLPAILRQLAFANAAHVAFFEGYLASLAEDFSGGVSPGSRKYKARFRKDPCWPLLSRAPSNPLHCAEHCPAHPSGEGCLACEQADSEACRHVHRGLTEAVIRGQTDYARYLAKRFDFQVDPSWLRWALLSERPDAVSFVIDWDLENGRSFPILDRKSFQAILNAQSRVSPAACTAVRTLVARGQPVRAEDLRGIRQEIAQAVLDGLNERHSNALVLCSELEPYLVRNVARLAILYCVNDDARKQREEVTAFLSTSGFSKWDCTDAINSALGKASRRRS